MVMQHIIDYWACENNQVKNFNYCAVLWSFQLKEKILRHFRFQFTLKAPVILVSIIVFYMIVQHNELHHCLTLSCSPIGQLHTV